eukprot:4552101-Prymnesium_polylepis.1
MIGDAATTAAPVPSRKMAAASSCSTALPLRRALGPTLAVQQAAVARHARPRPRGPLHTPALLPP